MLHVIIKYWFRFLRRLQKSIQRRVHCSDDSEGTLDPGDKVTLPLLAKSPALPVKFQKAASASQFKLNRQPRVGTLYHSLDTTMDESNSCVNHMEVKEM